ELLEMDKMKHSNYFYTVLKANPKVEAMWTMDDQFHLVAAIPYQLNEALINENVKQTILQNKVYVTAPNEIFETPQHFQIIAVPITNEHGNVAGHIGIQIKCL